MNVTKITPNPLDDQIEECVRRLDAVRSIAELLSVANGANALSDAITSDPKLLTATFDGITLMVVDAERCLHGI
jgi:hypothetical protein